MKTKEGDPPAIHALSRDRDNMKRDRLLVLTLVVLGLTGCAAFFEKGPPPQVRHHPLGFEVSAFYGDLAPYGDWFWIECWGWVWTPRYVDDDWRPYTRGHWVWTSLGWTWASDESWGWATS